MKYGKMCEKLIRNFLCILLVLLFFVFVSPVSAQTPTVSIDPSSQTLSLFSDYKVTVDIIISDVSDLCGFQFDLGYNVSVLEIKSPSNVSEGPFLSNNGGDPTDWTSPKISSGLVDDAACVRLKENGYVGVNGDGVLATVEFNLRKDKPPGSSYLNLYGIKLSDRDAEPITFASSNGLVESKECLNGEERPCMVCGVQGNRTCENYEWGLCNATCPEEICDGIDNDLDGYVDNSPGMGNYTLTQDCSVNHMGICSMGTETCTVSGWLGCPEPQAELCNDIDEDCDGDNNECLGDITDSEGDEPDGCVNIFDLSLVSSKFGLVSTDAAWDPRADVVVTSEIDVFDLVTVAMDFGNGPNC